MANLGAQGHFALADVASQDFVLPGFGGEVPKAAIVICRHGTTNEALTPESSWSWGFIDNTGAQGAHGTSAQDAVTTMNIGRGQANGSVIYVPNNAGTAPTWDYSGELIQDGIRLTRIVGSAGTARSVIVMLLGGDGIQAKVVPLHRTDQAVTGLLFKPNAHLTVSCARADTVSNNNNGVLSMGAGVTLEGGTRTAACAGYASQDNATTMNGRLNYRTDSFLANISTSGTVYTQRNYNHNYNASGMTATSQSSVSDCGTYLFLRVEDEQVGLVRYDYPQATGQWLSEAFTFVPTMGLMCGTTRITSSNTVLTGTNYATLAAMVGPSSVVSASIRNQDGVGTTSTDSSGSDNRFQGLTWDSEAVNVTADFVGATVGNEFEMNVTALGASQNGAFGYQWCLAFGGIEEGGGSGDTVKQGASPVDAIFAGATPVDAMFQGVNQIF